MAVFCMAVFCVLIGSVFAGLARAAALDVRVDGLGDEARDAVLAQLELAQYRGREVSEPQLRRLQRLAPEQVRDSLEPFGFYDPAVDVLVERRADGAFVATVRVKAGEPVLVRRATVAVSGEGSARPAVREAVDAFVPREGDRLDHALYERSKAAIQGALTSDGYLAARAETHRVEVVRAERAASVDLRWQSGPRHRFGDVRFSGGPFADDFLQRFVPWRDGAYYSGNRLLALQQRLVDADYFSVVVVQPDLAQARPEAVPVDVLLVPAKRSVYSAAAFLSTDTGPGVRLGFERRWLNARGHKARIDTEYSQFMRDVATSYRIPLPGDDDRSFNFGAAWRDEQTDTTESRTLQFAANETRRWRGYLRTLGLRYLNGDFEVGSERGSTQLLYPELVLTRKRSNDSFFPTRGRSLTLAARVAAQGVLSRTSLAQARADAKWLRSVGANSRLILRGAVGATIVDDFERLPPELRFFAGGDRSVRGFDYQAIGPKNAAREVTGGRNLVVGSVEFERYFGSEGRGGTPGRASNWGAAAFIDAGDAFSDAEFKPNVGAGLGLRWKSPVGLVRIDLAVPLTSGFDQGVRVHVVIGPDL